MAWKSCQTNKMLFKRSHVWTVSTCTNKWQWVEVGDVSCALADYNQIVLCQCPLAWSSTTQPVVCQSPSPHMQNATTCTNKGLKLKQDPSASATNQHALPAKKMPWSSQSIKKLQNRKKSHLLMFLDILNTYQLCIKNSKTLIKNKNEKDSIKYYL